MPSMVWMCAITCALFWKTQRFADVPGTNIGRASTNIGRDGLNLEQIIKSGPDYGLGFQVTVVPSWLGGGYPREDWAERMPSMVSMCAITCARTRNIQDSNGRILALAFR